MQNKSQNDCYIPADDSFFLEDYIKNQQGHFALDIGTGSGILAKSLSENFDLVVATDINMHALDYAHKYVENCICCNAADALQPSFDLVVCNLPYLPSDDINDIAVDGLDDGVPVPSMIMTSAGQVVKSGGKMILLTSSLANYEILSSLAKSLGFDVSIGAKKRLFYEDLVILECKKR
ncbi:MAG: methyltransferase [Thaumarchaeota archaeon]|nr:methyltransferase [Nitrososphaerota archaeon]